MADTPIPGMQAVPGQNFENGQTAPSQAPGAQLPPHPHLAPLNTNNNPLANPLGSPSASGIASPTSAGGSVRRAAPEPNKQALYIGGLDPRVSEDMLRQIFETTGTVLSVKIIPDKNVSVTQTVGASRVPVTNPQACRVAVPCSISPQTPHFCLVVLFISAHFLAPVTHSLIDYL